MRTVVRRLTVETVTRRRKVVSTSAHLLMASHRKNDLPMGRRMAALAQSTTAWWKISPWLHLINARIFIENKNRVELIQTTNPHI